MENIINPIPPIGMDNIANQGKVIHIQLPSWHACPVVISVIQAPNKPMIIGDNPTKTIPINQSGSLVK